MYFIEMDTVYNEKCLMYCSVSNFFAGRSIFLTGGTGFMGKVLLFKLLKSCPDLKNIYLLMRPKRGVNVDDRLRELINAQVFAKLQNRLVLGKIVPIKGDISQPNLGISEDDQRVLMENVSIMFHLAATIKFDETLKDSVMINVLGTQRVMELCYDMPKLEAFVHVSTAYSNCDRQDVMEMVYPMSFKPEHIIQCVDWMNDELIDALTKNLLGKHPNTYTFTKALAEQVILTKRKGLPIAIIRPSVVLSSLHDPEPGWVDSMNGPNKIIACMGRGLFRSVQLHGEKRLDIIPVDFVVNLMICSAWHTALTKPKCEVVYNCCSGQLNPISWQTFVDGCISALHKYPSMNLTLKPYVMYYRNKYTNYISDFILHMIPAILYDYFQRNVFGKSSFRFKLHRKFCMELTKLQYFALHEWQFYDYNVRLLHSMLDAKDQKEFLFDVTDIDWTKYLNDYVLGIRTFVLKESLSSIPNAIKRQRIRLLFERVLKILTFFITAVTVVLAWKHRTPHLRYYFLKSIFYLLVISFDIYLKATKKYVSVSRI